jgi:opacity protein-like surface antigen
MKVLILLSTILLFGGVSTFGQSATDKKLELFGGYSFENVNTGITSTDLGTTTSLDNRFNANGFHIAGTGYLNKRLGLTADFSGHYASRSDLFGTTTAQSKFSLYNITGGPQFRFPTNTRFTPFVQGLAGAAHRNLSENFTTTSYADNTTSFALNLGGGVDYKLNDRFAWRLFQFDYNPIFPGSRTVNGTSIADHTLNGFRFSTGIVIK